MIDTFEEVVDAGLIYNVDPETEEHIPSGRHWVLTLTAEDDPPAKKEL